MRVRTLLLGACMIVVPLLAMFSHHLPPNLAATTRQKLWEPVAEWAGWQAAQKPLSSPPTPARPDPGPAAPVAAIAAPPPASPRRSPPMMPTPGLGSARAPARLGLEGRLVQLGATSIGCQPLQGGSGMLASCRVAVDPAGELQRVFQAAGTDASTALAQLVADVEAWKQRTASRSSAAPGPQ